ncbi:STAS domain-containing protein [Streptomyces sp. NPDC005271]|uniref:STAS domain-containing protein n=1 Tax=unclassified Streptomyces TaxID=2593676 RepID=UPI0033BEE9E5
MTESYPEGARVVVVVRGELDYDAIAPLTYTLRNALHRSVRGVDVDLRAVRFWDCSALNVLLRLRQEALADGRTVAIRSPSPIVKRVLALTGTSPLFAHSRGEAETHQEM